MLVNSSSNAMLMGNEEVWVEGRRVQVVGCRYFDINSSDEAQL